MSISHNSAKIAKNVDIYNLLRLISKQVGSINSAYHIFPDFDKILWLKSQCVDY